MRSVSFCWLLVAGALAWIPASAEALRSPWDAVQVAATDEPYNCPAPPAFARTHQHRGLLHR